MRTLIVVVLLSGCLKANSVACDDGRTCPTASVCDDTHALCVSPDQVSSCVGQAPGASCPNGFCTDGVCLPEVCGDKIIEGDEACDDGNLVDGDGCSSNCKSDESCGNQIVDISKGEQCDDGNHLDHDGCSSACKAESPQWIRHTLEPPERWFTVSAYDSRRDRIVVFGGEDPTSVAMGDTLEWNGADWSVLTLATSPGPRYAASMAFDSAHGKAVLFGGRDTAVDVFGDTWLWDGVAWTPADATQLPPPRYGAGMAYDPRRHVVVMFGGTNGTNAANATFSDTWEWDGATWTQNPTTTHPNAREYPAMAYDPKLGAIVLTGGDNMGSTGSATNTWTYNGTWQDVTNGTSPPLTQAMMTYDLTSQQLVLFGGFPASVAVWTWNGSTWTNLGTAAGPSVGSRRTGGVFASTGAQLVLFGGALPATPPVLDTFFLKLSPSTWTQPQALTPRAGLSVVNDPLHRAALVFGGETDAVAGTTVNDTYVLSTTGLTPHNAGPSARAFASAAFDPVHGNVVLFGGTSNPTTATAAFADTWIWNNSAWTGQAPATIPTGRQDAMAGFDGVNVTMVGGLVAGVGVPRTDAFTWTGSNWATETSLMPVAPVVEGAAGYDPMHAQLVMFGGYIASGGAAITTTRVYDGTTLTTSPASFPAAGRAAATMSWNPARRRLTLVGGVSSVLDAFEWDGTSWHLVEASGAPGPRANHGGMTSLDGTGVTIIGGELLTGTGMISALTDDRWELRWNGPGASERCDGSDLDGDGLVGCADPDCWPICAPLCPPGAPCDPTAPHCGDGVCEGGRESCATCPQDCNPCAPVCGNGVCDPGETNCPGDCP